MTLCSPCYLIVGFMPFITWLHVYRVGGVLGLIATVLGFAGGLFLIKVPLIGGVFIVAAVLIGMLVDDGYRL